MIDEKEANRFLAILKGWLPLVISLVTGTATLISLITPDKPRVFKITVFSVSAVGAVLLWLFLLSVCLNQGRSSEHPAQEKPAYTRRQRAAALAGLLGLPMLAVVVVFVIRQPPPPLPEKLPPVELAVAIAGFTNDSTAVADIAKKIPGRLADKLADAKRDNRDLSLWFDDFPEQQIQQSGDRHQDETRAKKFGRTKGAHLVIWGEVSSLGGGRLVVRPKVATAYEWTTDAATGDEGRARIEPVLNAQVFKATDEAGLDKQIEDLARLLVGAAYYRAERWDKAIPFFSSASAKEASLWLGLSYERQARPQRRNEKRSGLENSLRAFEEATKPSDQGEPPDDWLMAVAYLMSGDAYLEMPSATSNERQQNLRFAVGQYQNSLQAYQIPGSGEPGPPWQLQNNLGLAWYYLGEFQKAGVAYSAGLGLLGENEGETSGTEAAQAASEDERLGAAALLYLNRGSAQAAFSRLEQEAGNPQDARKSLENAKRDFQMAQRRFESQKPSFANKRSEAKAKINLANTLADLALLTPGDDGEKLLRDGVALYKESVGAYPEGSLERALAEKSLAETYYDLGKRLRDIDSLKRARDGYKSAIPVLNKADSDESGLELDDAWLYLVKTLQEMIMIYTATGSSGQADLVRRELKDAKAKVN